ncbi:MAG: hypothetical protein HOP19_08755 [Acidobacteria bacterium]|nr:hypothetical protein [Acidobacteriota bacterium]
MSVAQLWKQEDFPIVYEGGEPKAVIVDVASFAQIELLLNNFLNRDSEPEDALLIESGILTTLVSRAKQEPPTADWRQELDEL